MPKDKAKKDKSKRSKGSKSASKSKKGDAGRKMDLSTGSGQVVVDPRFKRIHSDPVSIIGKI